MRLLEVNSIEFQGADRRIEFQPGLNVVLGSITTGKSTLVKLIRALFTSVPNDLAEEAMEHVSAIRAACKISDHEWNILRRLVTTDTSIVEIVGKDGTFLTPARKPTSSHPQTYSDWLLSALDLPRMVVPAAPTRPDSEPSPVTFSDYFNYCILREEEIDSQVFGSEDTFRDIKRKYVFEITYGLYDSSIVDLQTELRSVESELNYLRGEASSATRIFAGTELESIEAVRVAREDRLRRSDELERLQAEIAQDARISRPTDADVRLRLEAITHRLVDENSRLRTTMAQEQDLRALVDQLRSQEARLTRAAVAGDALIDFDFILCPRCGHSLDNSRGDDQTCALCLQEPPPAPHPDDLRKERGRIEDQIIDTIDLLAGRSTEVSETRTLIDRLEEEREQVGRTLNDLTSTFVSDRQVEIAQLASERSRIQAEIAKYDQYLAILERAEDSTTRIAQLSERRIQIRQDLDEGRKRLRIGQSNVSVLEARFQEYLELLRIPTFDLPLAGTLNSTTYLPIVSGRSFDRLSSQGLKVLVNVAHSLAHHTVAIDRDLPLPGLLVIDGPSSNIGTEGYDQERLADMYDLFVRVSDNYAEQLQIIVVDNSVPPNGQRFIRASLSVDDRLLRIGGAATSQSDSSAA